MPFSGSKHVPLRARVHHPLHSTARITTDLPLFFYCSFNKCGTSHTYHTTLHKRQVICKTTHQLNKKGIPKRIKGAVSDQPSGPSRRNLEEQPHTQVISHILPSWKVIPFTQVEHSLSNGLQNGRGIEERFRVNPGALSARSRAKRYIKSFR